MICLGIESTAHTFSVGIMKEKKVIAVSRDMYVPPQGGINPLDAKNHHEKVKDSYSAGPGLPPCLKTGAQFVKQIAGKKPIIEVNHCIAHIEIGRLLCKSKDPIVVYVSGGNTQIIGYAAGRYRVFGETQDIPIGNAIDVFVRETYGKGKKAETFGGPILEKEADGGKYIELPYVVKGMDMSFSGIMTSAIQKYNNGSGDHAALFKDLAFSFQETCYAMLTEVTERALAHTGKKEVLLVGGVAASKRFRQMIEIMCKERGAKSFVVPQEFSGDQGAMIAWTGLLAYKNGQKPTKQPDYNSLWRTDQVDIKWM
jgi:glycoprotease/Kae1 family metallohydrolase